MEYIFENAELKMAIDCEAEELKMIAIGLKDKRCQEYDGGELWEDVGVEKLYIYGVYRVKAPEVTPNEVDWSQFPPEYKYIYTVETGETVASNLLPRQMFSMTMAMPATVAGLTRSDLAPAKTLRMLDGEKGFKRGTVASKDSLLVRPVGE